MSLTYQSREFAEAKILDVHGEPALGTHLLRVRVEVRVKALYKDGPDHFTIYGGKLSVSLGNTRYLGRLFPVRGSGFVPIYEYASDKQVELLAEVSSAQMLALEDLRAGDNVTLVVGLEGVSYVGPLRDPISAEIQHRIPRSLWLDILKACKYRETMLIEVPVTDPEGSPALQKAAGHLREAQEAMGRGQWREAVGACRDVLEALSLEANDPDEVDGKWPEILVRHKDLDRAARMRVVRRALKLLTHPARHVDEVTVNIEWQAEDARFALAVAAAAVRRYSVGKP